MAAAHDQHYLDTIQAMDRAYTRLLDACEKIESQASKGISAAVDIVNKVHVIRGPVGSVSRVYDNVEEVRKLLGKIRDIMKSTEMTKAQREAFSGLQKAAP